MTDETESAARRGRRVSLGLTALTAAMDELEHRARAERLAMTGTTEHRGVSVSPGPMDWPGHPDRLARRDRPAYLARAVRRANGARRVSRVLREILGRLVKRANL